MNTGTVGVTDGVDMGANEFAATIPATEPSVEVAARTETDVAILGGVDVTVPTENESNAPVASTPGKAARAAKSNDGEKREYTKRGTTYWCRRVTLLDGKPIGRGKPAEDTKGKRRVVYIPVDMEYDVTIHGEGVRFNPHTHAKTHKRINKEDVSYVFDDGKQPAAKPAKKTPKTATAKPAKKTAAKPAKKPAKPAAKPAKQGNAKSAKAKTARKPKSTSVETVAAASTETAAPAETVTPESAV